MKSDSNKNLILMQTILPQVPEQVIEQMSNFQELMMMYHSAIREVTTKLEILNDELSLNNKNNPIQFIKSRIKKPFSIINKLQKLEKDISVDSIMTSLNDVAGIRVICSFIDDVYKIADMLVKQDDIVIIDAKDYIKNPKDNGYRSLHIVVSIPVFLANSVEKVPVEIQIRTIGMDMWASLEHKIRYKNNKNTEDYREVLKQCANEITTVESKMQNIHSEIFDE